MYNTILANLGSGLRVSRKHLSEEGWSKKREASYDIKRRKEKDQHKTSITKGWLMSVQLYEALITFSLKYSG